MTIRKFRQSPLLRDFVAPILMVLAVASIYHGWLTPGIITSGDWVPTPVARMLDYWPFQSLWPSSAGLGGPDVFGMVFYLTNTLYGGMARLGVDYNVAERVLYIFPSVLLACVGGYILSYSLYRNRLAAVITGLFLVSNSYIVIVDGGGQFTVGMAYAFIPWILWAFRKALYSGQRYRYVLTALAIALQGTYDLRLTYITIGMLALYVPFILANIWRTVGGVRFLTRLLLQGVVASAVELLVDSPWLLPTRLAHGQTLTLAPLQGYNVIDQVHALSFMQLSNALSLMHAFWPLNGLGHVAPLDPIFFITPLLVFLLLLQKSHNGDTLYLYVLSLVSVFLVKGSNPPGGEIYDWLFIHIPGFQWFRDPSKFYQPLMVAVALLFGLTAREGQRWLRRQLASRAVLSVSPLWAILCLFLSIYPSLPGIASGHAGTITPKHVPGAYTRLNMMIENQSDYFRVLWYPLFPRLGTFSELHPMIDATAMGSAAFAASQLPDGNPYSWLWLPSAKNMLQALSIKYVVVPSDPLHEVYVQTNGIGLTQARAIAQIRRYLPSYHETTIGPIHIFENPRYLPLVYTPNHVSLRTATPALVGPQISSATYIKRTRGKAELEAIITPIDDKTVAGDSFAYNAIRAPSIVSVQRDSSTWIEAKVEKVTHPLTLVFLQKYDPNWRAYVLPQGKTLNWWTLWSLPAQPQRNHMIGNGYGNAWLIDARGSFSVVLVYWPQLLVAVGTILGWLTIIGCASYIAFAWWGGALRSTLRKCQIGQSIERQAAECEPATMR